VADRATAEFMEDFYAELAAGQSAAESLRVTRGRWIADGRPAAAWAGFILVGGLSSPTQPRR
jgi:CHAT domain-containing protein